MSSVILVGTVHGDDLGPKRLEKTLNYFQPQIIAMEASPKLFQEIIRDNKILKEMERLPTLQIQRGPEMERIRVLQRCLGYELWVPEEYRKTSQDTNLQCIDLPDDELEKSVLELEHQETLKNANKVPSNSSAEASGELFTGEDIFLMSGKRYREFVEELYNKEYPYSKQTQNDIQLNTELKVTKFRDANFAKNIRNLWRIHPDKRIMAVLGLSHFFGGYSPNTYDLLADINPQRIKLNEADRL
jgi:hypothetical protein